MGHRIATATLIAAIFSTAGCGVPPNPPTVPARSHTDLTIIHGDEGAKAVVLDGPFSEQADSRALQGVLGADGAGCFTIQDRDGYTSTLVFPEGSLMHGPEVVILPDGTGLRLGAEVTLEGGLIPANEAASACLNYFRLFLVETPRKPA